MFSCQCAFGGVVSFEIDKPIDIVFSCEAGNEPFFVKVHTLSQVISRANIEDVAMTIAENVGERFYMTLMHVTKVFQGLRNGK